MDFYNVLHSAVNTNSTLDKLYSNVFYTFLSGFQEFYTELRGKEYLELVEDAVCDLLLNQHNTFDRFTFHSGPLVH